MHRLIIFSCLLACVNIYAQHNTQEIKQLKISKIIKQSVSSDAPTSIEKYESRYDNNGNETASYIGGEQFTKLDNQYNNTGKIIRIISYDMTANGNESSNSTYTYNADGSSTAKTTYKDFENMLEYKWFDRNGRLTKTIAPDKIEDIYTYDASGKLISVKTKPGTSDADVTDLKYTYNAKGQRIKEVSAGSYRWTRTYTYDAKGILLKVVTVSSEEGVTTKTTDTYKYEFWK